MLPATDCVRRYLFSKQGPLVSIYFHILRASGISTPRESVVQAAISYDVVGLFLISKEEDLVWTRGVHFGFGTVGNTYLCHEPRCWTPSLLLCGLTSSTPLATLRLCLCLCLCPLFPSPIIMDTTARWRDLLNTTHSVPLVQLLGTAALTTVEEIDLYFYFCFRLPIPPPPNSCLAHWATHSPLRPETVSLPKWIIMLVGVGGSHRKMDEGLSIASINRT